MSINDINIAETIESARKTLAEDKSVSPQLRTMMELLILIISLLVNKLGLNSRNSSKPPSSDPNRVKQTKRKTKGEKRNPGGQKGHKGSNLQKVENPDAIETLEIDRRTIPVSDYERVGYESRQVIEIEISTKVTEYRAEILQDNQGNQFVAEFPQGVTRPVQYGTNLKAQAVYMSQQQLIPYERTQDYFADQCSIPLSTGSLVNFNKEAFDLLEYFEQIAMKRLTAADVLHADETGINIGGIRRWLHSNSNDLWTLFFPHEKRGTDAMKDMGVLENFRGILCHDHWKPYFTFNCDHALCNAHHLRELERAWEQDGQQWAKAMKKFLLNVDAAVKKAGGQLSEKLANKFRKRYRRILTLGELACPPPGKNDPKPKRGRMKKSKARNLLERLRDFENEVLRFMTDKRVPFTNNQGENDIRMTKVQQKISGCFRSMDGARIFCRIRGYLSTCRKHGIQPTEALRVLFSGKLPEFAQEPQKLA